MRKMRKPPVNIGFASVAPCGIRAKLERWILHLPQMREHCKTNARRGFSVAVLTLVLHCFLRRARLRKRKNGGRGRKKNPLPPPNPTNQHFLVMVPRSWPYVFHLQSARSSHCENLAANLSASRNVRQVARKAARTHAGRAARLGRESVGVALETPLRAKFGASAAARQVRKRSFDIFTRKSS